MAKRIVHYNLMENNKIILENSTMKEISDYFNVSISTIKNFYYRSKPGTRYRGVYSLEVVQDKKNENVTEDFETEWENIQGLFATPIAIKVLHSMNGIKLRAKELF